MENFRLALCLLFSTQVILLHAAPQTASRSESGTKSIKMTEPSPTEPSGPSLPSPHCLELTFGPCLGLGYKHYSLPNLLGSFKLAYAEEDFYNFANGSLGSGCTTDPTFFCGLAFPPCAADSIQTFPCRDLCEATVESCASYFPFPMKCNAFPTEQPCLKSPFTGQNTNSPGASLSHITQLPRATRPTKPEDRNIPCTVGLGPCGIFTTQQCCIGYNCWGPLGCVSLG